MGRTAAVLAALAALAAACSGAGGATAGPVPSPAPTATAEPTPAAEPTATPEPTEATEAAGEAPGAGVASVATVFPLAWLAAEIAPAADHTYLAARGQDPHDLELTPGDRALLETAGVVVYMGALGLQPQVETAVEGRAGVTVSAMEVAGEGALHTFDHTDDGHSHDDDGHSHDDDDAAYDPHLWFDAAVMADVALAIGEAFAEADATGAEAYRDRATAVHDELVAVDAELDTLLSGCAHRTAIVSHEAYAYLLGPRGLAQEGISGAGGHGEASPQRLAELTRRIQEEGIPAVLAEPVEGRADAEALAREAGVDLVEIDPLEFADAESFATGYVELLRRQGERFAEALACG